jgi:hypothetical protein
MNTLHTPCRNALTSDDLGDDDRGVAVEVCALHEPASGSEQMHPTN